MKCEQMRKDCSRAPKLSAQSQAIKSAKYHNFPTSSSSLHLDWNSSSYAKEICVLSRMTIVEPPELIELICPSLPAAAFFGSKKQRKTFFVVRE